MKMKLIISYFVLFIFFQIMPIKHFQKIPHFTIFPIQLCVLNTIICKKKFTFLYYIIQNIALPHSMKKIIILLHRGLYGI